MFLPFNFVQYVAFDARIQNLRVCTSVLAKSSLQNTSVQSAKSRLIPTNGACALNQPSSNTQCVFERTRIRRFLKRARNISRVVKNSRPKYDESSLSLPFRVPSFISLLWCMRIHAYRYIECFSNLFPSRNQSKSLVLPAKIRVPRDAMVSNIKNVSYLSSVCTLEIRILPYMNAGNIFNNHLLCSYINVNLSLLNIRNSTLRLK